MGSWIGHIDGAIFFLGISLWWCYKIFSNYISVGGEVERYKPKCSYPARIFNRKIPIEIILKTLFPFCGFVAEILHGGPSVYDAEGNFTKLVNIQHMPIYGAFILHGLIDLADFYKLPVIKGANYMSASLAFFWYGYGFYFHATLAEHKEPLENVIHLLPVPLMLMTSAAGMVELRQGQGCIWPQLVRTWSVLNLGTWFIQASFVLYLPMWSVHNPAWDQSDKRNVMVIVGIFGGHLVLTLLFMCLFYACLYTGMRYCGKIPKHSAHYHVLNRTSKNNNKEVLNLLGDEKMDSALEEL